MLHEPGHLGDALRRRAGFGAGDARRPDAVRGGRDRRCRRLRADGGRAGGDAAAPRARVSATGSRTSTTRAAPRSRCVNIVGDHATYHTQYDAPLQSDIETRRAQRLRLGADIDGARPSCAATRSRRSRRRSGPPGQVATLILPADVSWEEGAEPALPSARPGRRRRSPRSGRGGRPGARAAAVERRSCSAGRALRERWARGRRPDRRGDRARSCSPRRFPTRLERGAGLPAGRAARVLARARLGPARRAQAPDPGGREGAGLVLRLPRARRASSSPTAARCTSSPRRTATCSAASRRWSRRSVPRSASPALAAAVTAGAARPGADRREGLPGDRRDPAGGRDRLRRVDDVRG